MVYIFLRCPVTACSGCQAIFDQNYIGNEEYPHETLKLVKFEGSFLPEEHLITFFNQEKGEEDLREGRVISLEEQKAKYL